MILYPQCFSLGKSDPALDASTLGSWLINFFGVIKFFGSISSWYKKGFFFYSENSHSPEQPSQGLGRAPSLEVLKMWLDRLLDNLTWTPFSTKCLPRWSFEVYCNVLWFYNKQQLFFLNIYTSSSLKKLLSLQATATNILCHLNCVTS